MNGNYVNMILPILTGFSMEIMRFNLIFYPIVVHICLFYMDILTHDKRIYTI